MSKEPGGGASAPPPSRREKFDITYHDLVEVMHGMDVEWAKPGESAGAPTTTISYKRNKNAWYLMVYAEQEIASKDAVEQEWGQEPPNGAQLLSTAMLALATSLAVGDVRIAGEALVMFNQWHLEATGHPLYVLDPPPPARRKDDL